MDEESLRDQLKKVLLRYKGYLTGPVPPDLHYGEVEPFDRLLGEALGASEAYANSLALEARIDEVEYQMDMFSYIPQDAGGQANRSVRLKVLKSKRLQTPPKDKRTKE